MTDLTVDTFDEEEVEPEQPPAPSLLEPIKQQGVGQGSVDLATLMMPGVAAGQLAAQRNTGEFTLSDLFGGMTDLATEISYGIPVIGDIRGAKMGLDIMGSDTDPLTAVFGALGLAGPAAGLVATGAVAAATRGARGAHLQTGARPGRLHDYDAPPVTTRYLQPDELSALSGQWDEPILANGIIATTVGRSRQLMAATSGVAYQWKMSERVARIREAITGSYDDQQRAWVAGSRANDKQLEGFIVGLGKNLVKNNPEHGPDGTLGSTGMDKTKAYLSAAAFELSKFDTAIGDDILKLDPAYRHAGVDDLWRRMTSGEVLSASEVAALSDTVLDLSMMTRGAGHPQFGLLELRARVSEIRLGGDKPGVSVSWLQFDGVPAGGFSEAEAMKRLNMIMQHQPHGAVALMSQNAADFMNKEVIPHWDDLMRAVPRYAEAHPALRGDDTVQVVPIADIEMLPRNPADDLDVTDLAVDIRENGMAEPLLIVWHPDTGAAKIRDGNKRLEAAKRIGLEAVPVKIVADKRITGARPKTTKGLVKKLGMVHATGEDGKKLYHPDGSKVMIPEEVPAKLTPSSVNLHRAPDIYRGIIPEKARTLDWGALWYQIAYEETAGLAAFHGLNHERLIGLASLLSAGELWEQNIDKAVVAANWLRDNPEADAKAFQKYMSDSGLTATDDEAKNVMALMAVPDDGIEDWFYGQLLGDAALKQPNFTMAILHADPKKQTTAAALSYGLYTGRVANTDTHKLFSELDLDVYAVIDRHAFAMMFGFSSKPEGSLSDKGYRLARRAMEIAAQAAGEFDLPGGPNGEMVRRTLSPSEAQALLWVRWREYRGVTKNYKTHDPSPRQATTPKDYHKGIPGGSGGTGMKSLNRPPLFVEGLGPDKIFDRRILDYLENPVPQHLTRRGVAAEGGPGPKMRLADLAGTFKRKTKEGWAYRHSGSIDKLDTVMLAQTPDGLFVVDPTGVGPESMRGLYPSYAHVNGNQILRQSTPMRVADIGQQQDLLFQSATGRTASGTSESTGSQQYGPTHQNPLMDGGFKIALSAPRYLADGVTEHAEHAHRRLLMELRQRGIDVIDDVIEPPHRGPAGVWEAPDGTLFWHSSAVRQAGHDPNTLPRFIHDEGDRVRMVMTFADEDGLSRAIAHLTSPHPHGSAWSQVSLDASVDYIRSWGGELLLRPVRGIKPEALDLDLELGKVRKRGPVSSVDKAPEDSLAPTDGHTLEDELTIYWEDRAIEIADAYEAAPVLPTTTSSRRLVRRAYKQFMKETQQQFEYITEKLGIHVTVSDTNPYDTPEAMLAALHTPIEVDGVRYNGQLTVLSTKSTGGHPILGDDFNDMFRAVHDFFGHGGLGNTFSRHGEQVAYLKHGQMYSELARAALFSETAAQNSWLIASKKNRAARARAEKLGIPFEAEFIEQKAVILDKKYWGDATFYDDPGFEKGWNQRRNLDLIYQEEVLDLSAYTNGQHQRPPGMIGVFEHHFVDDAGNRLVQMSADSTPGYANSGMMYVLEHDGMWGFFEDSRVTRHRMGVTSREAPDLYVSSTADDAAGKRRHRFTRSKSGPPTLWWDNVAEIANGPDAVRGRKGTDIDTARHLFDVEVLGPDGKWAAPKEAALYLPAEGTGAPVVAYGATEIPGYDPARTVIIGSSGGSFQRGTSTMKVEYKVRRSGILPDSFLKDDVHQFLHRTGWLGRVEDRAKKVQ